MLFHCNVCFTMEQHTFKNVNSCWNTKIVFYSETSGGKNSILYLNVIIFLTPVLFRYLWQLKTLVFLHRCLLCVILLEPCKVKCSINKRFYSKGTIKLKPPRLNKFSPQIWNLKFEIYSKFFWGFLHFECSQSGSRNFLAGLAADVLSFYFVCSLWLKSLEIVYFANQSWSELNRLL